MRPVTRRPSAGNEKGVFPTAMMRHPRSKRREAKSRGGAGPGCETQTIAVEWGKLYIEVMSGMAAVAGGGGERSEGPAAVAGGRSDLPAKEFF